MPERFWFRQENVLARRLRQEAIESRPEFSEELHVRLWHALERDWLGQAPLRPVSASLPRTRFWAAAALAAVAASVLCATVIGWRPRDVELRPQSAAGGAAENEIDVVAGLADHVSTQFDTLFSSTLTPHRWAYLGHDADLAMQFLTDRIPSDFTSLPAIEESP